MKKRVSRHQRFSYLLFLFLPVYLLTACSPPVPFHPHICYTPPSSSVVNLPSAFSPLSCSELQYDWAKEMKIGLFFASEHDFYRAITSFKRALVLIPQEYRERRLEIDYDIVLCYYLGKKYHEALLSFNNSCLVTADKNFPVYEDLLVILYDCSIKTGNVECVNYIFPLIQNSNPKIAERLTLSTTIIEGNLKQAICMPQSPGYAKALYTKYLQETKSVGQARLLNAILPGAGYAYVGQQNSALTAFLLNGLFIAAAVHFFQRGDIAAGVITTSLEGGWYFGGIYGAGRAAAEHNEYKYAIYGEKLLAQERLYPQLMLRFAF